MALSQTLSTAQLQKLSPQQIQGIKLLELPLMQLEERIKAEIEENPVLEEQTKETTEEDSATTASLEEYIRGEEGSNSYKLKANNASADDERRTPQLSQGKTLSDFLIEQLSFHNLSCREQTIAKFVIGTLDDDGYLRRQIESLVDDIAFKEGLEVDTAEVEQVISLIQQLEPAGIAARSLAECLLLQLAALRDQTPAVKLAQTILNNHFTEFSKKHYDKIIMRTGSDEEQLREAIAEIVSLNPKPANGYSDEGIAGSPIIIPDFQLDYDAEHDVFHLTQTKGNTPSLKINNSYLQMARQAINNRGSLTDEDRQTINFIKAKIDSAKWFISAINQRQQTLRLTMQTILDFQREYFKAGDSAMLRPMILKDIAELTQFDISTISRVVNSKYIDTHFGIFLLKDFFSEGMQTQNGEEVSTLEIKRIIGAAIEAENKRNPMTDEALMETLHGKGFKIARRTVAKYREMLDIPVARLRRQL